MPCASLGAPAARPAGQSDGVVSRRARRPCGGRADAADSGRGRFGTHRRQRPDRVARGGAQAQPASYGAAAEL
eukprot:364657-Chlamydomonas_euryale.AAC.2